MAGTVFHNVRLIGVAGAVPTKTIYNKDFTDLIEPEALARVIKVTGIEQYQKAVREQTSGDLCYEAANELIQKKGINKEQIGVVITVTQFPDYIAPSTAYILHKRLELDKDCICFDVNLGCTGYVYGLHIASSLLQSMEKKYALLTVGDAVKIPDLRDRKHPEHSNLIMFGDSGTASLLERIEDEEEIQTDLYSDGGRYRALVTLGRCRNIDASHEVTTWSDGYDRSVYDPYMDGFDVFQFSTIEPPNAVKSFLTNRNETNENYDEFYFHQANKMIVDRIVKKLKIDYQKVPMSISKFGNTGGATIPVTMVDHLGNNNSNEYLRCLLCGFGVGLSWGVVSLRLRPSDVLPMIYTDNYYKEGEFYPL